MFAFIPQIIKVYSTRSVKNVSLLTLLQFLLGVSFWVAYAIHLKDAIMIVANSVTFLTLAILLYLYFSYRKR